MSKVINYFTDYISSIISILKIIQSTLFSKFVFYSVRPDIENSHHLRQLIQGWIKVRRRSGGKWKDKFNNETLESDGLLDEMFDIKHEMINTNTDNHPSNNSGMELETLDQKSQQNETDFSIDPKKGKSRGYCRPNEVEKVKILKFIQEDYDSLYGEDMKIINGRPNREQIEVWNRVFQLCRGYVIF